VNEPTVVERAPQPYVAIVQPITMTTFHLVADRIREVLAWLDARGVAPVMPPFFKYDVIDMERELIVEGGVGVAEELDPSGDVIAGVLPGGRYVRLTHVGHPQELVGVITELLEWASARGLQWDAEETPAGTRWASRLEMLKYNPLEQPDASTWETELLFKLAD
jgi:DNA gyrase inhibitor GyrI